MFGSKFNVHYICNMKYRYVYSLINEGILFYIGCAKDISVRYSQHLAASKNGKAPVNKYIKQMLEQGIYPEINIICYLPEKEALLKEAQILVAMKDIGHTLMNRTYYYTKRNEYAFDKIKYRSDLTKIVSYRMQNYQFFNNNRDENGNQISFSLPLTPKLKTYNNEK